MTAPPPSVSRTFFDLPTKDTADAEDFAFLRGLAREGTLDWEQLLKADRVLIVSEAGMGKTYECQQQQRSLWDAGEAAFFLELADLGENPTTRLNPDERERFACWQAAQNERAVFFLDSIDELKLTSQSFQGTLKRFAAALGGHMARACIVLTTRPGTDDRAAVQQHLPMLRPLRVMAAEEVFVTTALHETTSKDTDKAPPTQWRYVALAPLDVQQQRALAKEHEVTDPDALLRAIEIEHAQEFAKRPLDFIELCEDWNASGRIRGHRDQIESNISVKLKPNPTRKEPAELSTKKAREGAERLSLAALLMRRFSFWHGKDTARGRGEGALDPARVLADWEPTEVRTLLERPLFGFATYARVRFHNRSTIEYLAAERLRGLIASGLAMRTLNRLLFVSTPVGVNLVRPTMQPVAAWLAPSLSPVMTEVLKRDPSLLLRFGDPGILDPVMRAQALERYVAVYGVGGWRGMQVPALQGRRLASASLSPTIARVWRNGIENAEVRETLLELIAAGGLVDNSDLAFEAATDTARLPRERLAALQALAAIGDGRLAQLLDLMGAHAAGWTDRLAEAAVIRLFPGAMTLAQLLGILAGLRYRPREVGGISRFLPDAIVRAELAPTQLETVRHALTGLIATDTRWDPALYQLRATRRDLVRALTRVCELQLRDRITALSVAESIALVLQLSPEENYQDQRIAVPLRTLLADAPPAVRSEVFWAQDTWLAAGRDVGDAAKRVSRLVWTSGMLLIDSDRAWLQVALGEVARPPMQRATAFEALVQLVRQGDDAVADLQALRPMVADVSDMSEQLEDFITAFQTPRKAQPWEIEQAKCQEERRRLQKENREFWSCFFRELLTDPDTPRNEDEARNLAWRLTHVMSQASADSHFAGWNRGFLERVLDRPQVERVRQLMVGVWREVKPTLPSEREPENRNVYYTLWGVGIAGIYAEAEDPEWARRLTVAEADKAMRYAATSMHGLPPWVEALAVAHPQVVHDLLLPELQEQLTSTDANGRYAPLLNHIDRGDPALLALLLDDVGVWVKAVLDGDVGKMHEADKFERAIDLLLEKGNASDTAMIRAAAQQHVRAGAGQRELLFWLPLLMRLTPADAVAEMERLAAEVPPGAQTAVTQWFGTMFGHNARSGAATPELLDNPALLARLTLMAYSHVRTHDDRRRDDSEDSNGRDDAEYARSQLLGALFKTQGAQAWREKLAFVENSLVTHFRDRGVALATQGLAEEWDVPLYNIEDVALLERTLDLPPVTRADMAALLRDRLDQLDDRLREDSSPRKTWSRIRDETELRRAVAAEMERFAKGAYTVGQEQITAEEKETDVRLRSAGYDMEAVIELKVGENGYSYKDLSHALRHQLVGRYMVPEARRVGCLQISIATNRRWKHPDNGRLVEIEEVVALLRKEADEIAGSLGYQSLLDVRALDLRPKSVP